MTPVKITTKRRLREHLICAAQGSLGHATLSLEEGEDHPLGLFESMGLEEWFRWIRAVQKLLGDQVHQPAFALWSLHRWETLSGAVDLLWSMRRTER
ncbi:MAG: hypothetical protein AAGN46_01340 [Acidobacteriota bacterium]